MRLVLLLILIWPLSEVVGQSSFHRIGADFGLCPAYVHFDPSSPDNWVGSKADLGVTLHATINWNIKKDSSAIGLGAGTFLWGDRMLYPVYLQMRSGFSLLYEDRTKVSDFVKRSSFVVRIGTVLGPLETTMGTLKPGFYTEIAMLYRIGSHAKHDLHAGVQMSLVDWHGPYQVEQDGQWDDARPSIFMIGPVLDIRF